VSEIIIVDLTPPPAVTVVPGDPTWAERAAASVSAAAAHADALATAADRTATAIAADAVTGQVAAHVAAADPHVQYLTPARGDARYDAAGAAAAVQAHAVNRAHHEGTQPANTIDGLAAVATSGSKADVGLANADNTSDANKPVSTAQAAALALKADLVAGKVSAAQLPSYVDDVVEAANLAAIQALTGESGKLYTALDTGKIYRWSGSVYVEISPSPGSTDAVPEGAVNLYHTSARVTDLIAAARGVSVQAYSAALAGWAGIVQIDGSNNVAIGMAPTGNNRLDVLGNIRSTTSVAAGSWAMNATVGVYVSSASRGKMHAGVLAAGGAYPYGFSSGDGVTMTGGHVFFNVDGSERARITPTGLGIGVAAPSALLHVAGSAKIGRQLTLNKNDNVTPDFSVGRDFANADGHNFYIYDNVAGTARVYVDGSGNIGVGTTAPACTLDVNGPVGVAAYTVATKPSAALRDAMMIYITNPSSGSPRPYWSRASNWYDAAGNLLA